GSCSAGSQASCGRGMGWKPHPGARDPTSSRSGHEDHAAERLTPLDVGIRSGGLGERKAAIDLDVELAARRIEYLLVPERLGTAAMSFARTASAVSRRVIPPVSIKGSGLVLARSAASSRK